MEFTLEKVMTLSMLSFKDKMVQVCEEWFPKGTRKYQKKAGFFLDEVLKMQIDILLKNIKNDWDFTIIITGSGEVRVGKSVLALQIGAYWTEQMWKLYKIKVPYTLEDNIVFDGTKLIKKGNELGKNHPYSVLIYDEAGADLEGRKVMTSVTQTTLDYFRECGQYNMLNILVLPEFFDLPKGIALSRSIFLLDVYYTSTQEGIFKRGFFNFFSKRNKKYLYLKGKKDLNYSAYKYNFHGRFYDFYPISEPKYRELKQLALSRRESKRRNKFQNQRDACWFLLNQEVGWTQKEISKRMEQLTGIFVARNAISDGVRHFMFENE